MTASAIEKLLSENIKKTDKLVLLLDYDGTLAPICPRPEEAVMPAETRKVLEDIIACENVYVGFISGRGVLNIEKMVGIKNITYAGSHGFNIHFSDGKTYNHTVPVEDTTRMKNIAKALETEVTRDGAWVENKGLALTYHFTQTPIEKREELVALCKKIVRSFGLEPSDAHNAIEVQPPVSWNKGYAGEYILKTVFGDNWNEKVKVIYAGDDNTDERLFEKLKGRATTFRIAASETVKTSASLRLPSIKDFVTALKWIRDNYKD